MPVELGGRTRFVRRDDVRFAEAQGDYVRLHTPERPPPGAHPDLAAGGALGRRRVPPGAPQLPARRARGCASCAATSSGGLLAHTDVGDVPGQPAARPRAARTPARRRDARRVRRAAGGGTRPMSRIGAVASDRGPRRARTAAAAGRGDQPADPRRARRPPRAARPSAPPRLGGAGAGRAASARPAAPRGRGPARGRGFLVGLPLLLHARPGARRRAARRRPASRGSRSPCCRTAGAGRRWPWWQLRRAERAETRRRRRRRDRRSRSCPSSLITLLIGARGVAAMRTHVGLPRRLPADLPHAQRRGGVGGVPVGGVVPRRRRARREGRDRGAVVPGRVHRGLRGDARAGGGAHAPHGRADRARLRRGPAGLPPAAHAVARWSCS